ncbi:MAG: hypothetical protein GQ524_11695 [Anaerolineales bacterium]|nr:hypothetical protein [Anaerolineales bacterium]
MPENDFEALFGPKPEPKEITLTRNVRGWRCSNQLWESLDTFVDEWPELMPRGSKSSLYRAAEELLSEVGEANGPRYIRWASQIVRNEKPELLDGIKNPRSFLFLLGRWRRERGGSLCPDCGEHFSSCGCEWGSKRRNAMYPEE